MTNADKLRTMTDEEMANKFFGSCPKIFGGYGMTKEGCPDFETCEECWLDWLKREAE